MKDDGKSAVILFYGHRFCDCGRKNRTTMNANSDTTKAHAYLPHILLLLCNLIWAMDYPFYHILAPAYLHPMTLLTFSLLVTALLSLLPLIRQRPERIDPHDIPKLVAAALLIGVMRKGFLMFGLSRTSPIDGSIINTLGPLLILVLSVLIGIDRFTKLKVAGLALGLTGAVAVILWGGNASHEHSGIVGNLLVLCGVAATAVYTVWFKQLLAKYRPTTVLVWVYCIAACVTLPFGIGPALHTDFSAWDARAVGAFLFAMCFLTYLPNWLFNSALKGVKPAVTGIYNYLQPIAAIAVSVAMGLDRLHWDTIFFALLVFAGISLVIGSYAHEKQ